MKKILIIMLVAILSTNGITAKAEEVQYIEADSNSSDGTSHDYALTATKVYDTDNETEYDFGFAETIDKDGLSFSLNSIEYSVETMYSIEIGDEEIAHEITVEENVTYDKKENYEPEETYESNGYKYILKDVSYEAVEEIEPFKTGINTEIIQGDLNVANYPTTMPYEYEGQTYDIPYKDYEVISEGWHDGYYLYGTITNYDAATYQIGDIIIDNNAEAFELDPRNYVDFLEGLDVPTDIYKVNDVYYHGDAYVNSNGVVCRDYVIDCQVNGTVYRLNYELDATDYIANITYVMSEEDIAYIEGLKETYQVTAIAYYDKVKVASSSFVLKLAIGTGIVVIFAIMAAIIVYVIRGGRRKTEDMNNREMKDEYKHL